MNPALHAWGREALWGGGGGLFCTEFLYEPCFAHMGQWGWGGGGGGGGYFAVHIVFLITGHVLLVIYQAWNKLCFRSHVLHCNATCSTVTATWTTCKVWSLNTRSVHGQIQCFSISVLNVHLLFSWFDFWRSSLIWWECTRVSRCSALLLHAICVNYWCCWLETKSLLVWVCCCCFGGQRVVTVLVCRPVLLM